MSERFNVRLLDLLRSTGERLVAQLDADACAISRTIGDVLIMVTDVSPGGQLLQLGAGYLVSDYPLTQRVLETGEGTTICLGEGSADEQEEAVLRELGYASLLMVPFELGGAPWGLVELYRREPRPFDESDVRLAEQIVTEAGATGH